MPNFLVTYFLPFTPEKVNNLLTFPIWPWKKEYYATIYFTQVYYSKL